MREKKMLNETHPALCSEWDYEKNGDLTPDQVTCGSAKKVWWICEHEHSFQKRPMDRTQGKNPPDYAPCPYCSHKMATPGEYSLATEHPELMEEWDWEANDADGIDPDNILPRSNQKAHWKCKNGHKWTATINGRTANGYGCPHCCAPKRKDMKFQKGVNDIATMSPELVAEWSPKNKCRPDELHYGSAKDVWWVCEHGHEWKTRAYRRTKEHKGCPYCSGHKLSSGNSLASLYPEIAAEWDYETNNERLEGKTPSDFLPKSAVIAAWQCPVNPKHKYDMKIGHRVEGFGCPYCSHHKILPEESLAAEYPELLEEWDWEKNKGLNPWELASGAGKIVWWKCSKGHEWKAAICDRTRRGGGCSKCQHGLGTSYPEQVFFFGTKLLFPGYHVINRYQADFGREIDVYIEELKIGLEPGSWPLHEKHLDRDTAKVELAAKHGVRIFTIYEQCPEPAGTFGTDYYTFPKSFTLVSKGHLLIRDLLKEIFSDFDFPDNIWDVDKWDQVAKEARMNATPLVHDAERSFASVAPELVSEWSPNNELLPDQVYAKSSIPVLWTCPKGHEYMTSPADRSKGLNCNICRNRVADPRYNTISKLYPEYVPLLSPDNEFSADELTPGNWTHMLKWVCPHCGETFERTSGYMFKGDYTICPHCREKMPERTPFNQLDY